MLIVRLQGGLGNQMFQYALYKSLEMSGAKVKLDKSYFSYNNAHHGYELEKLFEISPCYANAKEIKEYTGLYITSYNSTTINRLIKTIQLFKFRNSVFYKDRYKDHVYEEKTHTFNKDIFLIENKYLSGYWQNEKYFSDYISTIKKELKFKPFSISPSNKTILSKVKETNSVAIHIRRGDYINNANFSNDLLDYYQKAIKDIKIKVDNPQFFIFSDDIDYCKDNLNLENAYFIDWNTGENSFIDMYLMSQCKNNIIANSTFSWWAAYLNNWEQKVIYCPKNWFLNKNTEINEVKNWIKI
jgi:Glycosyl transferase family 11